MSFDSRYLDQGLEILESARLQLSNMKPSEWVEKNRSMTSDVTNFVGPFKYSRTPYLREIVDTLSQSHPARVVAVMKGAQIGFSTGVIESGIGFIMSEQPGNILFLTGHSELAEEAMTGKIDQMIDSCGLRKLIRPNVQRAKNTRTGDTNSAKEFPGGSLVAGSANNHKLLRQRSVKYGFIDDYEAVKNKSKESGSTTKMIEQRFASYYSSMKLYYISTPELKKSSNIEPVYLQGDQRKFKVPCPCCGTYINFEWSTKQTTDPNKTAGIYYETDDEGQLIESSVGYVCQECGGFFDEKNKFDLLNQGHWVPTAKPKKEGYYSYHISCLYAPPGMYNWTYYVNEYLEANPINGERKESLHQTFINLCLGETYEPEEEENIKANQLQKNICDYEVGTVPLSLARNYGHGNIVLITCAADMNGIIEDARLDYEIVGWCGDGSSFSIDQGSIGTFVPRENSIKNKKDRERWTYEHNHPKSVWPEFEKLINKKYLCDNGVESLINITLLDTGHYTQHAYQFIDKMPEFVVGVKGKDSEKYINQQADLRLFKPAVERPKLYLVEVNHVKDFIAANIKLRFDKYNDDIQPHGFMNFPIPSDGKYLYDTYFAHYEGEVRKTDIKEGTGIFTRWEKKSTLHQNHFWDCRVYNYVAKDIFIFLLNKKMKQKITWKEYANAVGGN